jgi:hypothetical protein
MVELLAINPQPDDAKSWTVSFPSSSRAGMSRSLKCHSACNFDPGAGDRRPNLTPIGWLSSVLRGPGSIDDPGRPAYRRSKQPLIGQGYARGYYHRRFKTYAG